MGEYIKFRARAAKASVVLAFLGLVAGSAGTAEGREYNRAQTRPAFHGATPFT